MSLRDSLLVQFFQEGPVGDFALGTWNERWIMSHEAVRCRCCLAPQWPSNADEAMRHCPGCDQSGAHYPLRELAKILANLAGGRV